MQAKAQQPAQRRAGGRRSRAGCSTCKRRRLKCDEGLPKCLRCWKANLHCSYSQSTSTPPLTYSTTSSAADDRKSSRPSIILPKLPSCSFTTDLSTARPSATLPGETEVENRYLRYFHQETTAGFQSAWEWTLWNRLVLQGSHHEPFIRHAVVAIGALHKSLHTWSATGRDPGKTANASQSMAKLHREFAYLSYGRALKLMQTVIDADPGPRHVLIACLLVVCFESHTGNRYMALSHAKHGLQILGEWTMQGKYRGKSRTEVLSSSAINVEDEIVEAFKTSISR